MYLLHTLVMHWITLGKKKLIICSKGENVEFGILKTFIVLQIRIMFHTTLTKSMMVLNCINVLCAVKALDGMPL